MTVLIAPWALLVALTATFPSLSLPSLLERLNPTPRPTSVSRLPRHSHGTWAWRVFLLSLPSLLLSHCHLCFSVTAIFASLSLPFLLLFTAIFASLSLPSLLLSTAIFASLSLPFLLLSLPPFLLSHCQLRTRTETDKLCLFHAPSTFPHFIHTPSCSPRCCASQVPHAGGQLGLRVGGGQEPRAVAARLCLVSCAPEVHRALHMCAIIRAGHL